MVGSLTGDPMHAFEDNRGRTWGLTLDSHALARVRELAGVDLAGPARDGDTGPLGAILKDPPLLVDVLFVLCCQAGDRDVSPEDFGRAMRGEPLMQAAVALLEEAACLYPNRKIRRALREAAERQR